MSSPSDQIRVLLIGFGNVGRQLGRILTVERNQFPNLRNLRLLLVGLVTGSHGSLVNKNGVDLTRALYEAEADDRFSPQNPDFSRLDSREAVESLEYDVLIELSTLSIERMGQPALSYIETALERGCHCVTANKGPIAFAYSDLMRLAQSRGCELLFESTVMDGTPVFSMAREGLKGCEILELEGILNSTSNFVLTQMENGYSMNEAIETAKQLGFAEADPRYDLEGWDAAVKICLLANVLMESDLTPFDIEREGIWELDGRRVQEAVKRQKHLKLLCRAWRERGKVHGEVRLRPVKQQSVFGLTSGAASVLRVSTDLMGPVTICQEEPSPYDTAYGVLNDLLTIDSLV